MVWKGGSSVALDAHALKRSGLDAGKLLENGRREWAQLLESVRASSEHDDSDSARLYVLLEFDILVDCYQHLEAMLTH